MGLCKCPRKKVTNLFCFEHRINVCEHCLLSNHPQCVVQTYLKWLQDSEYIPHCRLCNKLLSDHPTVRLLCLHVFHKHCLTKEAHSLPPTTATSSYTCITCQEGVFPDASNHSPIAEAVRESLATETWARPVLGLPVNREQMVQQLGDSPGLPQIASTPTKTASVVFPYDADGVNRYFKPAQDAIPVGIVTPVTGSYDRKHVVDSRETTARPSVSAFDCDEDKYRRRSLREWLIRWFRSRSGSKLRDDPLSANLRRWILILVLGLFAFLTVILMMTGVSSDHSADDPFLRLQNSASDRVQVNPK